VTVRNRNGVISFDVQRAGAWTMHFKYGSPRWFVVMRARPRRWA
jgi:hypothetical protein